MNKLSESSKADHLQGALNVSRRGFRDHIYTWCRPSVGDDDTRLTRQACRSTK